MPCPGRNAFSMYFIQLRAFCVDTMGCNSLQAISDRGLGSMLQWTGTTGPRGGELQGRCVAKLTTCCKV